MLTLQIALGSGILAICTIGHVTITSIGIPFLQRLVKSIDRQSRLWTPTLLTGGAAVIVAAHTVQIWLWAIAFWGLDALPTLEASFYFAFVTYTTLGYGDLTLGEGLRNFGAFAAITGLLSFGISTAILIGIVGRVLPELRKRPLERVS